jgi:hypothetical protein
MAMPRRDKIAAAPLVIIHTTFPPHLVKRLLNARKLSAAIATFENKNNSVISPFALARRRFTFIPDGIVTWDPRPLWRRH